MPLLRTPFTSWKGGGLRYFRIALAVLAVLFLAVVYDNRDFTNFSTPEAMDSAQLARNISEGNGYTTLFVRPFSMYLVKKANEARFGEAEALKRGDSTQIKGMHPDISNPPAYPALLAGLMKVLPFDFEANSTKPFWSTWAGSFAGINRIFYRRLQ